MYTSELTYSIRSNSCTYVHSMEHTTHVHKTCMHTRSAAECTWITHACAHTRLHGGVRHPRWCPVRRAMAKLACNGAYASLVAPLFRRCSTTKWRQRQGGDSFGLRAPAECTRTHKDIRTLEHRPTPSSPLTCSCFSCACYFLRPTCSCMTCLASMRSCMESCSRVNQSWSLLSIIVR